MLANRSPLPGVRVRSPNRPSCLVVSSENPSTTATILPQLRKILFSARPALASAIGAVIKPICDRHIPEVRAEVPLARQLDDDSVLDDLPQVLQALAEVYTKEDNLAPLALLGPAHASARDAQGFTVEEVYGEYLLLGRSLREHVCGYLARPLHPDEDQALGAGIDGLLST